MTLYQGDTYRDGRVSLGISESRKICAALISADVSRDAADGLACALRDQNVYHFSIYNEAELVGQIYLHDIDRQSGEAKIGYHLFQVGHLGQGIGTKLLRLLQRYVIDCTDLIRLVIITGRDNIASCRMTERCGFEYVGTAREDPANVVYWWKVSR